MKRSDISSGWKTCEIISMNESAGFLHWHYLHKGSAGHFSCVHQDIFKNGKNISFCLGMVKQTKISQTFSRSNCSDIFF